MLSALPPRIPSLLEIPTTTRSTTSTPSLLYSAAPASPPPSSSTRVAQVSRTSVLHGVTGATSRVPDSACVPPPARDRPSLMPSFGSRSVMRYVLSDIVTYIRSYIAWRRVRWHVELFCPSLRLHLFVVRCPPARSPGWYMVRGLLRDAHQQCRPLFLNGIGSHSFSACFLCLIYSATARMHSTCVVDSTRCHSCHSCHSYTSFLSFYRAMSNTGRFPPAAAGKPSWHHST